MATKITKTTKSRQVVQRWVRLAPEVDRAICRRAAQERRSWANMAALLLTRAITDTRELESVSHQAPRRDVT